MAADARCGGGFGAGGGGIGLGWGRIARGRGVPGGSLVAVMQPSCPLRCDPRADLLGDFRYPSRCLSSPDGARQVARVAKGSGL
jgi:hypothetical protein